MASNIGFTESSLASTTSASSLRAGQRVGNGRFVLNRLLGQGGMGIVWLARDEHLREQVALKFLPPQVRMDPVALDDMRRETARSHRLTHPHIVRIHDFYESKGEEAFISMEYVEGPNLASMRLELQNRVFSWDFLRTILPPLCQALDYAHEEKVIHRDLKPANLMLDRKGRLKLADFGIAWVISDSVTRSTLQRSVGTGTLVYMSPQQMAGETPSPTDDIYGLGATLYELLTSKPPFFSGDITYQVNQVDPKPLAERLKEFEVENVIPPHVNDAILACLSKNPLKRPQSASALLKLLELDAAVPISRPSLFMDTSSGWWKWGGIAAGITAVGLAGVLFWPKNAPETPESGSPEMAAAVVAPPEPVEAQAPSLPSDPPAAVPPPLPEEGEDVASVPADIQTIPFSPLVPESPTKPSSSEFGAVRLVPFTSETASEPPEPPASPAAEGDGLEVVDFSELTAFRLVEFANRKVEAPYRNNLYEVFNRRENPKIWSVVFFDPLANPQKSKEIVFNGTKWHFQEASLVSRFFGRRVLKQLEIEKLKVDSDQAYQIAKRENEIAEAVIRSYSMRLVPEKDEPLWEVEFWVPRSTGAREDVRLGRMYVSAETGQVVRKEINRDR